VLNHLLATLGGHTALLGDNVSQHQVDLTSHVGSVTTNVEVGLLLQQVADQRSILLQTVLNVDLLATLTREGSDDLEGVTHLFLEFLSEQLV